MRIKILFIIDSLTGGGAELIITEIANHFNPRKYDVCIVLTLSGESVQKVEKHVAVVKLQDRLDNKQFKKRIRIYDEVVSLILFFHYEFNKLDIKLIHEKYLEFRRTIRFIKVTSNTLTEYINVWAPNCIISFLPNSNALTLLSKKQLSYEIPIFLSDRNFLSNEIKRLPFYNLRRWFINKHYPEVQHIALTSAYADDLHRNFGIPIHRIKIIPNGVKAERIYRLAKEFVAPDLLPDKQNNVRIVAVGRLTYQKGYDRLFHSLSTIDCKTWQLFLVGTGEEAQILRNLSLDLGISDRVYFLGWQDNPYKIMALCDVFVLSSRWEGMPNVMLEAMTLGLPVVSTNCPSGPAEILLNGKYGLLVDNKNLQELADALRLVIEKPEVRQQLRDLSIERSQDFSFTKMFEKYENLISQAILDK